MAEDSNATKTDVASKEDLFSDLSPEETPTQIESLCMNCEKTGVTTLLLTKIPFFKEIVLMAFQCPHCGYRNNEIQSAGEIQEKGVHFVLKVTSLKVTCFHISHFPLSFFFLNITFLGSQQTSGQV